MAYGNWGATVYCDGKPLHKNCDTTIKQVFGEDKQYPNYLFHYILKGTKRTYDITREMFHAVVGDKESGVIVLLYKSYVSRVFSVVDDKFEEIDFKPRDKDWDWYDDGDIEIDVNGIKIVLDSTMDPEGAICEFKDKKGRQWKAKSAYCYGEGHREWG